MTPRALLAWPWTLVILALCWTPRLYIPDEERLPKAFFVPNLDKLIHMGIFAAFAFLWMRAARGKLRVPRVIGGGLALALLSELGQGIEFVNRDCNVADGVADMMGVLVGIVVYVLVEKILARRAAATDPRG